MEMNFCRRCGSPLNSVNGHTFRCGNGHVIFANPAPAVGIIFMAGNREALLSVRGEEPNKGMLDAFGGFIDGAESFEAAAERELREELALEPSQYEPLRYLTSAPADYLYKSEQIPILSVIFWSRLLPGQTVTPSDDVADTKIVDLHRLDLALLHSDDIRTAVLALRNHFPA